MSIKMVRIQRRNMDNARGGFASQWSLQKHFFVVFQTILIFTVIGIYLLLRSQEDRLYDASSLSASSVLLQGVSAYDASKIVASGKPYLLYGTAWKKEETARLVSEAVHAGFRFIDTACQPKHYNERGVGLGWSAAAAELGLKREEVFLQTKFTSVAGQDINNIPYDPESPMEEQIKTSLATSLKNLKTDYLDSWVMHSPYRTVEDTLKAWRIMEEAVDEGKVRGLGISNCYDITMFKTIYEAAKHKPRVLQNRFYADSNFDTELRKFCKEHGVKYQSFWTLTANRKALATSQAKELSEAKGLTPQTYMYAFLMSLGYVTPLSGTTNTVHMAQDVAVMERIQGGEAMFSLEEQREFARLLGMPEL